MVARNVFLVVLVTYFALAAGAKNKYKNNALQGETSLKDEKHIKRQVSCEDYQFRCNNGECIPQIFYCDSGRDCTDGSDEVNCPAGCTSEHEFECLNGRCVSKAFICDGDNDCGDLSDETDCHLTTCSEDRIQCDNYKCIPSTFRCDGDNDCGNGWDEENCTESCADYQFRCTDGFRCIPNTWVCDYGADCPDHSDEVNCVCNETTHFECPSGRCIDHAWRCDGDNDCLDFADEVSCPTLHPSDCSDLLSLHACVLMNESLHPICHRPIDGHKYCRKFCGLCDPDIHTTLA
ncbi:unnamed protein product [Lymnaea stagnalis]|uniref:Uncharacterized protein n=1 Tax=Lymnaea stagnalis TaxID=6523 RepID=A0AAV2H097_LYMST